MKPWFSVHFCVCSASILRVFCIRSPFSKNVTQMEWKLFHDTYCTSAVYVYIHVPYLFWPRLHCMCKCTVILRILQMFLFASLLSLPLLLLFLLWSQYPLLSLFLPLCTVWGGNRVHCICPSAYVCPKAYPCFDGNHQIVLVSSDETGQGKEWTWIFRGEKGGEKEEEEGELMKAFCVHVNGHSHWRTSTI